MVPVCMVIVALGLTYGRGHSAHAQVIGQAGASGTLTPQKLRELVRYQSRYGHVWQSSSPSISLRNAGLGGCPPEPSGLYCPRPPPDECRQDADCPLGKLCCSTGCNRQCTDAGRPGRCPSSAAELAERERLIQELVPCRATRPEQLECPAELKCCLLAGNHFCLPPVLEATDAQSSAVAQDVTAPKPGGCPHAPLERLRCRQPPRDLCLWDSQCRGDRKCCPSGCGLVCQPAARVGTCPAISWHVASRCFRDGRPKCYRANDHQCPQGLKCCHNGCVFSCVQSDEEVSTKAGFCPPPSFVDDFRPPCLGSSRDNACEADYHCPGPKKCCPSLCSRQCTLPLIEYR